MYPTVYTPVAYFVAFWGAKGVRIGLPHMKVYTAMK